LRLLHRSGDPLRSLALRGFLRFLRKLTLRFSRASGPPAGDGERQRDRGHGQGEHGLQHDQAQGQQVLDRVGIGLHRPGGGCGHQFCGVEGPPPAGAPSSIGRAPGTRAAPCWPSSGQAQG
jgi:hypothetical protein